MYSWPATVFYSIIAYGVLNYPVDSDSLLAAVLRSGWMMGEVYMSKPVLHPRSKFDDWDTSIGIRYIESIKRYGLSLE